MTSSGVVLGLGGTVDYEVAWDSAVLEGLAAEFGVREEELTVPDTLVSEREIVVALLAYLRAGAGGEHFVADREALLRFARRFEYRATLGGTNVRAAIALDKLGVASTVHLVSIDDDVRRLLPGMVSFVTSAEGDSTDPHVIVQFPRGATVRVGESVLTAPHENRVILVNDPPNREMVIAQGLEPLIAGAGVVMLSGFNSMDDPDTLRDRLATVTRFLAGRPPGSALYYEDAGFHRDALRPLVQEALAGEVDVWSMNEDELRYYVEQPLDLLDSASVASALAVLRSRIPARTLVVHTRYWAIAVGDRAPEYEPSLQMGVTAAAARFRHGDGWDSGDFARVGLLPVNADAARVVREVGEAMGAEACGVPSLEVVSDAPTTIGLGDTFAGGFLAGLPQARRVS